MNTKFLNIALGAAIGLLGGLKIPELSKNRHLLVWKMHKAQVELLKIDWGQPGFCTEWDSDSSKNALSRNKRGKFIKRGRID